MFLRSLALVKGTPATSATRSPQAAASSNTATHHAASRQPTVAAELVALTRLFKRLMRSRSAHGAAPPPMTRGRTPAPTCDICRRAAPFG